MGGVIGSDGTTFGKGGLFNPKTPKTVEAPDVPEPPPVPTVESESAEFAKAEERKRSGLSKTFLTGNLTPKSTGKKTTLG